MDLLEPEKRSEPRVPAPPIPVYASSEDDVFFYGYIKNISPSGMLILSYIECEVGQEYTLEFALPAKPKLSSGILVKSYACSSIRWCKEYAMAIYGPVRHGIKFIEPCRRNGKYREMGKESAKSLETHPRP